jgi:hypothetical protein
MIIVGAGMAGLLAAAMLRGECESILESQSELPNNHSAVLRFRSSIVGDTLNIPFRQVSVMKAVAPWRNPIADTLSYSRKTNGTHTLRSIVSASGEIEERFIAPPDLISIMAKMSAGKIAYDAPFGIEPFGQENLQSRVSSKVLPIISTLPMPTLMSILRYGAGPEFKYVEGININCELYSSDTFATLYVPDPQYPFNRISITGSKMTIELAFPGLSPEVMSKEFEANYSKGRINIRDVVHSAFNLLGIHASALKGVPIASRQRYAKILPIDNDERKRFILWASEKHGVYSLGRFATWRPGLLLDDLVNDVRVIQKIIKSGSYDHRK